MTVVELFDVSPLQNLSGVLNFPADTIYFAGSNYRLMTQNEKVYRDILLRYGIKAEIKYLCIPKYDISFAVEKFCEIAKSDKDVIFDVSGGDDYILAAAGIAAGRCASSGIALQHFSVRSGRFVSFGNAEHVSQRKGRINLTADEMIELHGGKIVYEDEKRSGTVRWDFEKDDFREDVLKMWNLCRRDCREWNKNCARMGELENFAHSLIGDRYAVLDEVSIPKKYALSSGKSALLCELTPHLETLAANGLITRYTNSSKILKFCFKNRQVRGCLLKAGNALELMTYMTAKNLKNRHGINMFSDTLSGVVLDWDGKIHTGNDIIKDTENEIDGLFIKGMIPVFVSCKNGNVDENELYKLSCVAEKFGIKYAKKVLVATDLQKSYTSQQRFYGRATEMGIKIIDGVHRMTESEFARKLASIQR